MKQWLIFSSIRICWIVVVAIVGYFTMQVRQVHRLDARYQQVQRGMSAGAVFTTMKVSTVQEFQKAGWSEECKGWWDETPLDSREESRIQYANRYSAPEFFSTVSWIFTFDKNDAVVGKHRFD